jgi:hypothetical protein
MTNMKQAKCQHRTPPEMSYIRAHADAQRRMKAGEKQLRCPVCARYIWQSYYHKT